MPEPDWHAMKEAMQADDIPHANWLRAAVREKLDRSDEYDDD